eukprot:1147734-Prorocentrum_minimum.AAC.2
MPDSSPPQASISPRPDLSHGDDLNHSSDYQDLNRSSDYQGSVSGSSAPSSPWSDNGNPSFYNQVRRDPLLTPSSPPPRPLLAPLTTLVTPAFWTFVPLVY